MVNGIYRVRVRGVIGFRVTESRSGVWQGLRVIMAHMASCQNVSQPPDSQGR